MVSDRNEVEMTRIVIDAAAGPAHQVSGMFDNLVFKVRGRGGWLGEELLWNLFCGWLGSEFGVRFFPASRGSKGKLGRQILTMAREQMDDEDEDHSEQGEIC
jgi:hypothetical protein